MTWKQQQVAALPSLRSTTSDTMLKYSRNDVMRATGSHVSASVVNPATSEKNNLPKGELVNMDCAKPMQNDTHNRQREATSTARHNSNKPYVASRGSTLSAALSTYNKGQVVNLTKSRAQTNLLIQVLRLHQGPHCGGCECSSVGGLV
jgi:hypothetical protein